MSSLALAADGTLYVGATSGTKPGPESGRPVEPPRTPQRSGDEAPSDNAIGGASVISEIPAANGPSPQISITQGPGGRPRTHGGGTGGSALYAIAPDGVVSEIWRSPDATLHSLAVVDDDVLIGTGNKGRVYRVEGGEETWSILVQSSSSQVTAIMAGSETIVVGSANAGDLLTLGTGHAASGTIESAAHDATTWSKWGRLTWDGTQPKGTGVTLSTRGGNTSSPDSSWSEWAQVKGESITSPNSRFMQWRAELESSRRDRSPTLRAVSASYQQRNLKPEGGVRFRRAGLWEFRVQGISRGRRSSIFEQSRRVQSSQTPVSTTAGKRQVDDQVAGARRKRRRASARALLSRVRCRRSTVEATRGGSEDDVIHLSTRAPCPTVCTSSRQSPLTSQTIRPRVLSPASESATPFPSTTQTRRLSASRPPASTGRSASAARRRTEPVRCGRDSMPSTAASGNHSFRWTRSSTQNRRAFRFLQICPAVASTRSSSASATWPETSECGRSRSTRVSRFGMVLTLQSPCFGMPSARPQKMSDGIRPRVRYP